MMDVEKLKDSRFALEVGKAAEHIVCADIILCGHRAYLSDQGLPYDVVVDINGRLIRVQVKATVSPVNMNMTGRAERIGYKFSVRRHGKRGDQRLNKGDCDVVALVALDINTIAYFLIEECGQTVQLHPPGYVFKGKYQRNKIKAVDGYSFELLIQRGLSNDR